MFMWLNKQGVKSDRGFSVQSMSRFTIEYREGSKKITLWAEPGRTEDGRSCTVLSRNAFERWDDDPTGNMIPAQKQMEISKNFEDAMAFQGISVIVDPDRVWPEKNSKTEFRR